MDNIIEQIRSLASKADHVEKVKIHDALRRVVLDLEDPPDVLMRIYNGAMRLVIVRTGIESGLFRCLSQSQGPLSVLQLAEQSNASPELFARITRYLAANQLIDEAKQGHFEANRATHILGSQKGVVVSNQVFTFSFAAIQAFPEFAHGTGYVDVTDNTKTPFQTAFQTDLAMYDWLGQHPETAEHFRDMMRLSQTGGWMAGLKEFDQEARRTNFDRERVFFVDVGGNSGHQCIEVLEKYPGLRGRLVLAELPEIVKELPGIPGVMIEETDILQKQKVKGAKFYYLRRILHNWPDNQAVQILQNLRCVMADDSRILIDDAVVLETNVSWRPALADLAMMMLMAGKERTRTQWAAIAREAGLRIAYIHQYSSDLVNFLSVVVLELDLNKPQS